MGTSALAFAAGIGKAAIGLAFFAEVKLLRSLKSSANSWYNDLTKPLKPILSGQLPEALPKSKDLKALKGIAIEINDVAEDANGGDLLSDEIRRIEKSVGVPFLSKRKDLRANVKAYLKSGDYVKSLIHGPMSSENVSTADYRSAVKLLRERHREFSRARKRLVRQISGELAALGTSEA